MQRPAADEHADYLGAYIALVPDGDILATLARRVGETTVLFRPLTEEQATTRYAPEKWSLKEVLGHLVDGERVFAYRALWIARGETTPLEGFEQDDFVRVARHDRQPLVKLVEEFEHARAASLSLFQSFDETDLARRGVASDNAMTVRAIAWILAGHELHHRRILQERYLTTSA